MLPEPMVLEALADPYAEVITDFPADFAADELIEYCPVVDYTEKRDIFASWRNGACMAFSLTLPAPWDSQGWKVKIRDRERLEPPHVTVLHRSRAWRWNLRTGRFMDAEPPPGDVPAALVRVLDENLALLRAEWDAMYPSNPVETPDD